MVRRGVTSAATALPPPTSVLIVLRAASHVRWQVVALPHVVAAISECLNYAVTKIWMLPRACKANLVSFLPRLPARGVSGNVDPYYSRFHATEGLSLR